MKTFITILFFTFFQINLFYGQIVECTPDPNCNEEVAGEGALCPDVLLPAHINVYYEAIFTIIPISEYEGIEIHSLRVDNITGLPEGFEWGKNEDRFYVTDPPTRYCAMIYGTTENEGNYPMDIYVTPFIYYQPPFGDPIVTEMPQEVIENAATLTVLGDPPIADFSSDIQIAQTGENVSFFCETIDNVDYRFWTFQNGNPETSEDENPIANWDTPGTYNVSLYVENQNGENTKLEEAYITVYEPVIADFSSDITLAEIGQNVNFFCNSTGDIQTRVWTFENGTPETSTEENPIVSWNQSGEFTVTLSIESNYSSDFKIVENYITILDPVFVANNIEKQISIYPNPAQNLLIIESETIIQSILLVDLKGKILKTIDKVSDNYQLNISSLKKGTYILKLYTHKHTFTRKFIIY